MGSLAVTHKPRIRQPFFHAGCLAGQERQFLPFNDEDALAAHFGGGGGEDIAAVIVEPVQGEGGVNPATPSFLSALRRHCDDAGALLIADEVQCGLGRIGAAFASGAYEELTGGDYRLVVWIGSDLFLSPTSELTNRSSPFHPTAHATAPHYSAPRRHPAATPRHATPPHPIDLTSSPSPSH